MFCPKCGVKHLCPCQACRAKHKSNVVWVWSSPDGPIVCGNCGLTRPEEWWMHLEWDITKEERDEMLRKFSRRHKDGNN